MFISIVFHLVCSLESSGLIIVISFVAENIDESDHKHSVKKTYSIIYVNKTNNCFLKSVVEN